MHVSAHACFWKREGKHCASYVQKCSLSCSPHARYKNEKFHEKELIENISINRNNMISLR